MNYENCRIGQLSRCNLTGCEWKKTFGGYCHLTQTQKEISFRKSKQKEEIKNVKLKIDSSPIIIKEVVAENTFKLPKQDDWISKIKVKL